MILIMPFIYLGGIAVIKNAQEKLQLIGYYKRS